MTKKFMTFKHWQTGEIKTIEFRDADVPANPSSERLVVWNETEQKLEDVIKSTIVEIREEGVSFRAAHNRTLGSGVSTQAGLTPIICPSGDNA